MFLEVLREITAYKINSKTLNKCHSVLLVWLKVIRLPVGQFNLMPRGRKKNDFTFQQIEFPVKLNDAFEALFGDENMT